MMKRKIAHVVLSLQPGGLERLICNLAAARELRNFETLVCCLDEPGALAAVVERSGARVVTVSRTPGRDAAMIVPLARLFRSEHITAVHTHSLDPMLYAGWAAKLAGVPVRIHTQHLNPLGPYYRDVDRLKFRTAAKAFTRVVAISAEIRDAVTALGVPHSKLRLIFNGIDESRFAACGGARTGAAAEFVIGTAARLSPQKGIDRLLDAFARVYQRHPHTRLVIAGDGPLRPELEAQAERLGIGAATRFLGFQEDVPRVLAGMHAFVLPSLYEGLPLSLLEAMAAGLPVIATNVNGVPEVIEHGRSGILAPAGDVESLACALEDVIANPELRERLGTEAARRVADAFSLGVMARGYARLYYEDPPPKPWRKAASSLLRRMPRRLVLWRARTGRRAFALTLDDGPDPDFTPQILNTLARHGARATFFVIGEKAARYPDLVRRILAEGHELGNHSHTHPDLHRLPWKQVRDEIARAGNVIASIQGRPARLFRPPRGKLSLRCLLAAWANAMTVVMWSLDPKDFRAENRDEVLRALSARPIEAGDIVLYHATTPPALEALSHLLETARHPAVPVADLLI